MGSLRELISKFLKTIIKQLVITCLQTETGQGMLTIECFFDLFSHIFRVWQPALTGHECAFVCEPSVSRTVSHTRKQGRPVQESYALEWDTVRAPNCTLATVHSKYSVCLCLESCTSQRWR